DQGSSAHGEDDHQIDDAGAQCWPRAVDARDVRHGGHLGERAVARRGPDRRQPIGATPQVGAAHASRRLRVIVPAASRPPIQPSSTSRAVLGDISPDSSTTVIIAWPASPGRYSEARPHTPPSVSNSTGTTNKTATRM